MRGILVYLYFILRCLILFDHSLSCRVSCIMGLSVPTVSLVSLSILPLWGGIIPLCMTSKYRVRVRVRGFGFGLGSRVRVRVRVRVGLEVRVRVRLEVRVRIRVRVRVRVRVGVGVRVGVLELQLQWYMVHTH